MFKIFVGVWTLVAFIVTAILYYGGNPSWEFWAFLTLFNYINFTSEA